jgi:hypothetical protein
MEREVAAAFRNADPSEILTTVRREIRGRTKRREEEMGSDDGIRG